jgi:hypothetical protein
MTAQSLQVGANAKDHCRNPPELKFDVMAHSPYSPGLSALLSLVWRTQRGVKEPSTHLGPRSGGSGPCLARCSAGARKLMQLWTKCVEKVGTYVENDVNVRSLPVLK